MAGLVRLRNVQKLMCRLTQVPPAIQTQNALRLSRAVGTSSNQKSESVSVDKTVCSTQSTTANESKPIKHWVSYGFSDEDQAFDRHAMHLTFFVTVSICLTLGAYGLAYIPDFKLNDWALREGYLELRRREQEGLPPIDINLIDPAKIKLPTDEELGDQEIFI